jgi:hypothetical protein
MTDDGKPFPYTPQSVFAPRIARTKLRCKSFRPTHETQRKYERLRYSKTIIRRKGKPQ